eukprot:TRINITY_DN247_c2_g1_i1.p1 TRINITY_DN247_c2_g1~~TRINITY_DN247_c2_g1_i1.p1  ORF type:complete len:1029 (+),score=127.55 TRINITY_DN247_c2_g1_i1:112-3198(+)
MTGARVNNQAFQNLIAMEDVVRKNTDPNGHLGVVWRVAGQDDQVRPGLEDELGTDKAEVWWHDSQNRSAATTIEDIHELQLVDRSFLPGDVVSLYSTGSTGQMGTVVHCEVFADLTMLSGAETGVLRPRVNARRHLHYIHPYHRGSFALAQLSVNDEQGSPVAQPHLCRILECRLDLIIEFNDGSYCLLEDARAADVLNEKAMETVDEEFPFYLNQTVTGADGKGTIFQAASYLVGRHKRSHREGTVVHVVPTAVEITVVTVFDAPEGEHTLAEGLHKRLLRVHPSQVTVLDYIWYTGIQLGNFVTALSPNFLALSEEELSMVPDTTNLPTWGVPQHGRVPGWVTGPVFEPQSSSLPFPRTGDEKADFYRAIFSSCGSLEQMDRRHLMGEVTAIHTYIDVEWQDGTVQRGIPSTDLFTRHHLQNFDIFTHDFVQAAVPGATEPASAPDPNQPIGVVRRVNHTERTCDVTWLEDPPRVEDGVSVYDLICWSDVRIGDMVVWLPPEVDRAINLLHRLHHHHHHHHPQHPTSALGEQSTDDEVPHEGNNLNNAADDDDTTLPELHGVIEATPQAADTAPGQTEQIDQVMRQISETVLSHQPAPIRFPVPIRIGQITELYDDGMLEVQWHDGTSGRTSFREVFVVSNDDEYWDEAAEEGEEGDASEAGSWETVSDKEGETPTGDDTATDTAPASAETPQEASTPTQNQTDEPADAECTNVEELPRAAPAPPDDAFRVVSRFEVVDEFVAHHYTLPEFMTEGFHTTKELVKRVRQEWKILEESLPPRGIIVKASGSNMQLMKILISGCKNTPYYRGIYAFDLRLPNDYPNSPPLMYFHSYGLRLNPNLYDNGKICLSLLGTWDSHHQCEKWTPASNILQVLLSLSGLVLCTEPYYNEAGYENHLDSEEGRANSDSYNEQTVRLKVTHFVRMLQCPPPDVEIELRQCAREVGPPMCTAIRDYILKHERGMNAGSEAPVAPLPASTGLPERTADEEGLFHPPTGGLISSLRRLLPLLDEQLAPLLLESPVVNETS